MQDSYLTKIKELNKWVEWESHKFSKMISNQRKRSQIMKLYVLQILRKFISKCWDFIFVRWIICAFSKTPLERKGTNPITNNTWLTRHF